MTNLSLRKLPALALALLTILLVAAPASADVLTVNGSTRTYYPYIPDNLGDNRPLLISMHGMNQDAGYQRGMLQIEAIADTAKFAVVFPEGIDRSWDIGGQRDINFVLAIIDEMHRLYNIDTNRVYLSGFSMGGMFTYHAMNHIADRIAAFAPISGYPMGGQPFTSSRPVPIIHTHGTGDDVVTFDNVHARLDGWIARNGCSPTALVTEHYRTGICTRHEWGPGDDGAEVVLIELANKGHWISNDGFFTGEEIWNFCKRFSLADRHPKLSITSPRSDAHITTVGTDTTIDLRLEAEGSSEWGDIASIAFYGDNKLVGVATEAPYSCVWTGMTLGDHIIKAVITDTEGNTSQRGIPVTVTRSRKTASVSFFEDNVNHLPEGWITYNGRTTRFGSNETLTAGARVIQFTGEPRGFNYALYVNTATGKEDSGYAIYADPRTNAMLLLTPGTYELGYYAAHYNMPEGGSVRCRVINNANDEVIAETSVYSDVSAGNATNLAFGDPARATVGFVVPEVTSVRLMFLTDNVKGADMLINSISVTKKSTDTGIADVNADATEISAEYYDLAGRRVANPAAGAYIRRAMMSDGSVRVTKIVR